MNSGIDGWGSEDTALMIRLEMTFKDQRFFLAHSMLVFLIDGLEYKV